MAIQPPIQAAPLAPDAAKASWQVWFVLGLIVLGACVRFVGIANLSFYGDEETTAFAAISVLESGRPAVPSGMNYNRAPLYSYMAAAAAAVLGDDREISYRLPALVFGILSMWLMWIGSRRLLGVAVALTATALIATSEWHAATSGYARMYAPYVALFMCTAYCFLEWSRTRSPAVLGAGIVLFLLSGSFHILTVFVVGLLLLPHFVVREIVYRSFWIDLGIAVVLAVGAIYLDSVLVQSAYTDFAVSVSGEGETSALGNVALFWVPMLETALGGWTGWVAAAALLLSALAMWRFLPFVSLPWNAAVIGLGLLATLLMVLGQAYAMLLCLYLLAVLASARGIALRYYVLSATGAVALALLAAIAAENNGYIDYLTNPNEQVVFPYLAQFFAKYPIVVGAALLAPLFADHRFRAECIARYANERFFTAQLIRVLAMFFVLNLFAFGLFGRWYEDRYIVHAYPLMLVLAAYTLVVGLDLLVSRTGRPVLTLLGSVLILALLMPHHLVQGLYRGTMRDHGDSNLENGRYFPDHASVGTYVRERLQPGDVVVATDVLQQRWYVGQADFWLRSEDDIAKFLYKARDGRIRDIYVNAEFLSARSAQELLHSSTRVWVIVSSVDIDEDWAFSPTEREFMSAVQAAGPARYEGRDGRSQVFLLGSDA